MSINEGFNEELQSNIDEFLQNRQPAQTRLKCSFPVFIESENGYGESSNGVAIVEDISRRGICFKTVQELMPGDRIAIFKADETDLIAQFETVWVNSYDGVANIVGAQIIGDNYYWLQYLSKDLIVLPSVKIERGNKGH